LSGKWFFDISFINFDKTNPSNTNYIRMHHNIIFLGHVDSGKSTVCGHLLYLHDQISTRELEKNMKEASNNKREGWGFSYGTDLLPEERERGKTIETGRACFTTNKKRYTILDAPGHKAYVPNMMISLAQADVAVLIVSARTGEFEAGFDQSAKSFSEEFGGGQTKEHITLGCCYGIKHFIVFINKIDSVEDPDERVEEIRSKVGAYFRKFGVRGVDWVVGSGLKGDGLDELVKVLDNVECASSRVGKELRLPVLDNYALGGKVYNLGKVEYGCVGIGDVIGDVKVLGIESDFGNVEKAIAGENIRLITDTKIPKGTVLGSTEATKDIVVKLHLFDVGVMVTPGYKCILHTNIHHVQCTVVKLLCQKDAKGNVTVKNPKYVKSGVVACYLQLDVLVGVEKFDDFEPLGRVVLRGEGRTVGFGKVISKKAPKSKVR